MVVFDHIFIISSFFSAGHALHDQVVHTYNQAYRSQRDAPLKRVSPQRDITDGTSAKSSNQLVTSCGAHINNDMMVTPILTPNKTYQINRHDTQSEITAATTACYN